MQRIGVLCKAGEVLYGYIGEEMTAELSSNSECKCVLYFSKVCLNPTPLLPTDPVGATEKAHPARRAAQLLSLKTEGCAAFLEEAKPYLQEDCLNRVDVF